MEGKYHPRMRVFSVMACETDLNHPYVSWDLVMNFRNLPQTS